MAAPWGAIVQAIDHAMGRMHDGGKAGINVADSQHGGAASGTSSPAVADTGKAGDKAQDALDKPTDQESSSDQPPKAPGGDQGGDQGGTPGGDMGGGDAGGIGGGDMGSVGGDMGGAGGDMGGAAAGAIASDERLKAREKASSVVKNWHRRNRDDKLVSDEKTKVASKTGEGARQYAANAGNGFAEAGRIATGQSSGSSSSTKLKTDEASPTDSIENNYQKSLENKQKDAAEAVK